MDAWLVCSIIVTVIFVIILGFCIYMLLVSLGIFSRKKFFFDGLFPNHYIAGTILQLGESSAGEKLDELELSDVSMRLERDESCYFEGEGYSCHTKEVVAEYQRHSSGRSMRVMRGYSIHRSDGYSQAVRQTVRTKYPGRLFITNERIVFLAERYGFDIKFDKLSNISVYDSYLEVFAGSKFYRVFTPYTVFIRDLIVLMNLCHEEQYLSDDDDRKACAEV